MKNKLYKLNETTLESTDTFTYDVASRLITSHKGNDQQAFIWWGDQEKFQRVEGTLDRNTVTCLTEVNRLTEPVNQIAEHEHKAGQKVIQNDIWAHPTALNKICARALEGDKNDLEFYHKNYLDHVYAVSNDSGNIIEHYRYTAFGEPEIYAPTGQKLAKSAIDNTVMWNSRRYDADTNLYYYKYRHYKSDIGRWLSRDPIEEDGGVNLYAFVGNDIVNSWDKLGLSKIGDVIKLLDDPAKFLETKIKKKLTKVAPSLNLVFAAAKIGVSIAESLNKSLRYKKILGDLDLSLDDLVKLDNCMIEETTKPEGLDVAGNYIPELNRCICLKLNITMTGGGQYRATGAALKGMFPAVGKGIVNGFTELFTAVATRKVKTYIASDITNAVAEDLTKFGIEKVGEKAKKILKL